MNARSARQIATIFGLGTVRPAPGTLASLAALPIAAILHHWGGTLGVLVGASALFGLGVAASAQCIADSNDLDPPEIVIDEVVGIWLALAMVPLTPLAYGLSFALFRLFDIWKPGPVGWVDENVKGGIGVMLDDIVAGAITGLIMFTLSFTPLPGIGRL